MIEKNRNLEKNINYLFAGLVLISISYSVFFLYMSLVGTNENKYKKSEELEQIKREYLECRKQDQGKVVGGWQGLLVKCISDKLRKEEELKN